MNLDRSLYLEEKEDGWDEQEMQSLGRQGCGDGYTHSFEGKVVK